MFGHCAVPSKPHAVSPSHTANRLRINTCRSASKQRTLSTFRCNTYKKPGGGRRSRSIPIPPSPILRTHFQVPYALTPFVATLTKTAGVWGYSSHFGKASLLPWTHESSRAERGICFFFRLSSLLSPSLRKRLRVDPRHQLQRIFVVHLLQDFVRHLEAVNPPESMALAVILKIF